MQTAGNARAILPRLPVPDLEKTLSKYLDSLKPFLLEEATRTGTSYDNLLALRSKWVGDFTNGLGNLCQQRLYELDKSSPDNWLDDNFWLKGYLQWRAPLLVNSNWWLVFNDDPLQPSDEHNSSGFTSWQLQRASWLVHRTLEFKDKIESQEIHPVTTRTGVWFQENVGRMFNIARIPQRDCDTLSVTSLSSDPLSHNVIVIVNNWFYTLRAYDPSYGLIGVETFLSRLNAIVRDATTRPGLAPEIGVLSADERDTWASNLQCLKSISPDNSRTHEAIVKALMCLCLDNVTHTLPSSKNLSLSSLPQPSGISQASLDSHLHAIRSTASNVSNHFFDKPFSIVVDPAGRAGATGEHSPCDALIPSIVAEYAVAEQVDMDSSSNLPEEPKNEGWDRLDWVTDDRILQATRSARERAEAIINNSDDSILWFEEYGSDWMKSAGFSPDAYIQLAMQLAWYCTMGEFTATYETALTRMFHKGRTETIRTLSEESRAFVLAMVDLSASNESKHHLLQRAIRKHTTLTRDASTGRGIDRHLLGLRNMLQEGEKCDLFEDPLFAKSQEWRLSTSGLSAGHYFRGTGFGAAYENGYGINYLAAPSIVKFGVETKLSGDGTSTTKFKSALVDALREMKNVVSVASLNENKDNNSEPYLVSRL
ncbi:carnitine acetyltransferase [Rhodocollybia butyracea]|uniref:Carnitine acetyltransferase n=1 Tax=Rhodocollybia butyracea TaxID=206335 RepID=A0A9P5PQ81_9AGAR|nr:carnitine acetyltransferase [Rhodocollybia butyracea]